MSDINRVCKDCGETFIISSGEQNYMDANKYDYPVRCRPCRDQRKVLNDMTVTCKVCRKTFTINGREAQYYFKHNLELPQRCLSCRQIRKEENA